MTAVLEYPTLVLNRNWQAINTVPVKRAISMVAASLAKIIDGESFQTHTFETWAELSVEDGQDAIHTVRLAIRVPEIITVLNYKDLPERKAIFSRKNIYRRDHFTCQYCSCKPGSKELTIDHVLPRCLGGISSWDNCVLACVDCNRKKAHKTLSKSGMKLSRHPVEPEWTPRYQINLWKRRESWKKFVSTKYWETELQA